MQNFQRIYSDDQRDAVCEAWGERGVRPAERVAALAAAGELTSRGELVEAFSIPAQTVRDMGRKYLRRRAGLERSRALLLEPRDQVEALRRRLVCAVEHELDAIEREQARKREVPGERLRQIARAARELAALPTPNAPPAGARPARNETRGGLAGSIMRAARSSSAPAPVESASPPSEPEAPELEQAMAENAAPADALGHV